MIEEIDLSKDVLSESREGKYYAAAFTCLEELPRSQTASEIAALLLDFVQTAFDQSAEIAISVQSRSQCIVLPDSPQLSAFGSFLNSVDIPRNRRVNLGKKVLRSAELSKAGIRRVSFIPIHATATLAVGWKRPRGLSPTETSCLRAIALQAGASLRRLYFIGRARQSEHRAKALGTLYEIIRDISAQLDLERVLNAIVHRTKELFDADASYISLINEAEAISYVCATVGIVTEEHKNSRAKITEGIGSLALRFSKTQYTRDYFADKRFIHPIDSILKRERIRSVMCAPLMFGRKRIGLLYVANRRVMSFTADEVALLTSLADIAAIAVDHAQLHNAQKGNLEEFKRLYELIDTQHKSLERAVSIHNALTHLVLENRALDEIASLLARLTNAAIILEDQFHNTLCAVQPDGRASPTGSNGDVCARILAGSADNPNVYQLHQTLVEQRLPTYVPALPELGLEQARVIVPIVVDGEIVGYLTAVVSDSRPPNEHLVAVEYAATVFALEIAKEKAAVEFSLRLREDLLTNLFDGTYGSAAQAILGRATYFGYNLTKPHIVVAFSLGDGTYGVPYRTNGEHQVKLQERFVSAVSAVVGERISGSITARKEGNVIVLVPGQFNWGDSKGPEAVAKACEQILEEIQRWLPGETISVGVGRLCQSLADYPASYREACQALRLTRVWKGSTSMAFERLGIYRLLSGTQDQDQLREFAAGVLRELAGKQVTRHAELRDTLRTLCAQNFNLRRTAATLHVHINTLRYRLDRISHMLGVDLHNPETRLHIHMALKILDLLPETRANL